MIEEAIKITEQADIFIIIGTSLNVYPAAGLIHYVPRHAPIYLIDPKTVNISDSSHITHIQKGASEGINELINLLKK